MGLFLIFCFLSFYCKAGVELVTKDRRQTTELAQEFFSSFINFYDFTSAGRYTHEYHPFLFEKASHSLDDLEESLIDNGFKIKGRIVVAGYEEQAAPTCISNYSVCTGGKINDEDRSKCISGYAEQLHNKFGVMTGFLFRGCTEIGSCYDQKTSDSLFGHVNLSLMPIYGSDAWFFQKYFFGEIFDLMLESQKRVNRSVCQGNTNGLWRELLYFWQKLYENEAKSGDRKVLGTQDVLFSMAHVKHLCRSDVRLCKYYTGPDVTYPIKVNDLQKKSATFHAQTFIKEFVQNLVPRDNRSTAYVFCSFVDGVGKSTLLGNVKNYKEHGENFDQFDIVDNSSSQLSEIYKYDENVYIADLPAQISHFTYKPDGMVYVDIQRELSERERREDVQAFVIDQKNNLLQQAQELQKEEKLRFLKNRESFIKSLCDESESEKSFIRNIILLKKEKSNSWIPFSYDGRSYIFDEASPASIRVLVPLEKADSTGLKNSNPEQMLFFKGVRFPLLYQKFVCELVEQLKEEKIENIVFVDFLSMYPRSSRENVRVNYILQQLAMLYGCFDIEMSPYRKFTNDAELFCVLKKDRDEKILDNFTKESFVRFALYTIMDQQLFDTIDGVSLDSVTELLKKRVKLASSCIVSDLAKEKVSREIKVLERVHGRTKNFVNIQELAFDDVVLFSKEIQNFLPQVVTDERLCTLWQYPGDICEIDEDEDGFVDRIITLKNNKKVRLLYVLDPECKNESILAPAVRMIRASWYGLLANVADLLLNKAVYRERFTVSPLWVNKLSNGKIAVFQRCFDAFEGSFEEYSEKNMKLLNISKNVKSRWGAYNNVPYLLSGDSCETHYGFYAFGCNLTDHTLYKWPYFDHIVSCLLKRYKDKEKADVVMSTCELYKSLEGERCFGYSVHDAINCARKKNNKDASRELCLGILAHKKQWQFIVRSFVTLEMILKDPKADVVLRRRNREDFVAGLKLAEKVMLPQYLNVIFEQSLFDNYYSVNSIIKSDNWE